MVQSLENITNSVNTTQISPDTVTEEQLHYLKFDLHTWVSSICGCVTVLKHLAQQDIHSNHQSYVAALSQLEKVANDIRDVVEAIFSPHDRKIV